MRNPGEIEQSILGCMMVDFESAYVVMDRVCAEDFHVDRNRQLFQHLQQAAVDLQQTNFSDLMAYLTRKIDKKDDYDIAEIAGIYQKMPSSANLDFFIASLLNASRLRKLALALNTYQKKLTEDDIDYAELVSDLEGELLEIGDETHSDIDLKAVLHEVVELLGSQGGMSGLSWGLTDLDNITGGLEPGKTYVVGGLKKSGKTKLALNTSLHLALQQNVRNGWISLEMGRNYLVRWMLSHVGEINAQRLKQGKLNQGDWSKITMASGKLGSNSNMIFLDDRPGLSIAQIRSVVRRFARKGCQVVFLDYLQRVNIKTEKGENRATAIQHAATQLADMAKEYDVALVYLSQLKNAAEGKLAGIGDLKESGGIGEAVDCAIIINNMDRISRKKEKTNISKFVVEQRDGASGVIDFVTQLEYSKYLDKAHENGQHTTVDVPF